MATTLDIAREFGVSHADVLAALPEPPASYPEAEPKVIGGEEASLVLSDGHAKVVTARLRNSMVDLPPSGNRQFTDRREATVQVLGGPTIYDERYETPDLVVDTVTVIGTRSNVEVWTIHSIEVASGSDGALGRPDRRTFHASGAAVYPLRDAPAWLLTVALRALGG